MAPVAEEDIRTEIARYALPTQGSRLNPSKSASIEADLGRQCPKTQS